MKLIEVGKEKHAMVSDEDYLTVSDYKWYLHKSGYPRRSVHLGRINGKKKTKSICLHHEILPNKKGFWVDHIDRNKLNNTRENLRYVTPQQSNFNKGAQRQKMGIYKGVHWNKKDKRWRAEICVNRKIMHLGNYLDEYEAHLVYTLASKKYFGEFAGG